MDQETRFQALVVEQHQDGKYISNIKEKVFSDLPEGEVLIKVVYSSLNYKDALSSVGNKGVTKNYPHTPGIDAMGYVEDSTVDHFQKGQPVIVTGFDLGMNTAGGFASYIRVPAAWVLPCPTRMTLKTAAIWGTAGFTAALSIKALLDGGLKPPHTIVVTGASGGVGSLAVGILAHLGFEVLALTRKGGEAQRKLISLGARILNSSELNLDKKSPLTRPTCDGAVDTVGGNILASLLKQIRYGGVVTCCGLAASSTLDTTVFPFILRGVTLAGIDSVQAPLPKREWVWERLADDWNFPNLEDMYTTIDLAQLPSAFDDILRGQITGRIIVEI